MGWPKIKNKLGSIQEIKKNLAENPDEILPELGDELRHQDFSTCWQVLREILPLLDKTRARDFVRLLCHGKTAELKDLLQQRDEREQAIECLGYLPSRDVVELLVSLLSNKDDAVCLMAAGALKNHTPRLVVPLLVEGLVRESLSPPRAGEVLLAMGFLAQEALMDAFPVSSAQVRTRLLELMVLGDNPKCQPLVEAALHSDNPALQKKALEAAAHFGFSGLWTEVVMCLATDDWTLKAKAIEVLATLKVKEALEFVELFLNDPDPWVSRCANDCVQVLRKITKSGDSA